MDFQIVYPDVLGAIAGQRRQHADGLQYALGLSPAHIFINQPFELVIVLQSMIKQDLAVQISLRLPKKDRAGRKASMAAARTKVGLTLRGGEVTLLRIGLAVQPPTRPGRSLSVEVQVKSRPPRDRAAIRPPSGGPPPSVLAASPFRVQALQDVAFVPLIEGSAGEHVLPFEIEARQLGRNTPALHSSQEVLWTPQYIKDEAKRVTQTLPTAREIAMGMLDESAYWDFVEAVSERFGERGLPLHPGEARAIARMMAYTVDQAPTLETAVNFENMRWFRMFSQVLTANPELADLPRGELLANYVFEGILFDSIGFGFRVVEPHIDEDLGSAQERIQYATKLLAWLGGDGEPDLNYIYLPLAMGGLIVNRLVRLDRRENPWLIVDGLREAYQGRIRLASGGTVVVFEILRSLLDEAAVQLTLQRVQRD